ncbi:hypothetical protein LIER_32515 [Lithospermum erythrorhizon]|uniref:Reverse transcriptase RNase H-like domain-containing protein n=1 Tax=Lithospermum erythrorhizon TaxID=34254 RepID=A0AAV3RVE0_LITER
MRGAETGSPVTEKLVFALVVVARKLKPYFEEHPVEVVTDKPVRQILENSSCSGRIVKWGIELSEFDLRRSLLDEGGDEQCPGGEGNMPRPCYQDILEFLSFGVLPEDPLVANKIQRQSLRQINSKALTQKILGSRIFWPSIATDAQDHIQRARQASAHGKPGKLEFPWEGPYLVKRIVGPVTYELEILEGRQVPRSWNTCHLRKYYV